MTAAIIDGKGLAAHVRQEVRDGVEALIAQGAERPCLAVVLVGDDPASHIYVRNKVKACEEVGILSKEVRFNHTVKQWKLLDQIRELNEAKWCNGILVQLPLPDQIDPNRIIEAIDPKKDVDGFHPYNIGRLAQRNPALLPCTPQGCMMLLRETLGEIRGMHAVMVGASNIVGRPMGQLLLLEGCTVTQTHRFTKDTAALCREADIVVAAVGKPGLVRGDWIKPGATVIDVGINRVDGKIVGDCDGTVWDVAGAVTPVPGGVGPMTIACLLKNTLESAQKEWDHQQSRRARAVYTHELGPEWIQALEDAPDSRMRLWLTKK